MASFAAFLEVGVKKYPLFCYELSMHQETDTLGRPASPVLGGTIVCTLSSPGQQDPFLYQWMLSPVMQHDGLIRLTDPMSGATLKTISFFNAYCTNMDLTFIPGQNGGAGSSLIQLQISPQRVAVGAITHDNNWPVASHGSGQSFVSQEQPQPKPKPKPGIVVEPPQVGLPRMPRIPPTTPPGTPPRVPPKLPQILRNIPRIPLPHPALVFLAALLGWHDAGVADEWEQKLPEKDEQRYRELEAKRSKETAKGGKLSPQEEEEYQALEKRKYPYGRGGTSKQPSLPDSENPKTRFPKLDKHYEKHADEWSPPLSKQEYYERARDLADAPVGGSVKGFTSKEGYTFRYDEETGDFLTMKPDGTIETMFKPERGKAYYLDQLAKYEK